MGQLSSIKIDNMREQHNSLIQVEKPQKPLAMVAVAAGEGLAAIFKDFSVDGIVAGGQSMNPSAEDIAKAVTEAPSDTVFVLPNNKNIILAAEQAGELTGKKVIVIPTKSFPQGLNAVLAFNADASAEENETRMRHAMSEVKSAQITYAIRDTHLDGEQIYEGEVLGLLEGKIVVHCKDMPQAAISLLGQMVDDDASVISLYYGENVSVDDAEHLHEQILTHFDTCDVELYNGKQAVYEYILSVE